MIRNGLALGMMLTVVAPSTATAASYVLEIKPGENQQLRFDDGRRIVDDQSALSGVRIFEPKEPTDKLAGFIVIARNGAGKPITFGPENVTIALPDGATVAMTTYDELMKRERTREAWQALAMGLAAGARNMQAAQAGYSYGNTTYSGSTYGSFGSTPFRAQTFGTANTFTYNPGAVAAAQSLADQQNQNDLSAMAMAQAAARQNIAEMLKTTTIDPGQALGGLVRYDMPKAVRASKQPVDVVIQVKVGDEVHKFSATLKKR